MQSIFARITKVDEERREVIGRAVQQVVDRDNECFSYDTSKPEFMKWSAEVQADTNGASLGNVRSMHGNIAAGKVTDLQFNDAEKAIDIAVKVVDDNEWKKCLEGVHTGFSIGGRYAKRWQDVMDGKLVTMYTAVPTEISLVDRPCVPTAKFFSVHKSDGSIEKRAFKMQTSFELQPDGRLLVKGGPGSGPHPGTGKAKSRGEGREHAQVAHAALIAQGYKEDKGARETTDSSRGTGVGGSTTTVRQYVHQDDPNKTATLTHTQHSVGGGHVGVSFSG